MNWKMNKRMKLKRKKCLPLIVVVSTIVVASFEDGLEFTELTDFSFKLFSSISFCDNGAVGFFGIIDGDGATFFSSENIALV